MSKREHRRFTADQKLSIKHRSISGAATRDIKLGAGGKGTILARKTADRCRDFMQFYKSVHRYLRAHVLDVFVSHLREQIGACARGSNAIHQNARDREFLGEQIDMGRQCFKTF
jgi:hypothetical protein